MYKTFHIILVFFIVFGCAGHEIQHDQTDLISSGKHHISDATNEDRHPADVETRGNTTNTAEITSVKILDSVAKGDLVTIQYTARLENGTLLYTTLSDVADDPQTSKSVWYVQHEHWGAEQIVAGGENILPGLGQSIIGMKKGESKTIAIPPEYAFGMYDRKSVFHIDRVRIVPRNVSIPKNEFIESFSVEPVVGEEVYLPRPVILGDYGEIPSDEVSAVLEEPGGAGEGASKDEASTPELGYEASGLLDMSAYTCSDCIYSNTCPKVGEVTPAECGTFQWRST